jgi:hypothetical protein
MMQEKENPWIMSEKQLFGKEGAYNFDGSDWRIKDKTVLFYRLQEENEKLKNHVNMRVDQMAD